MTDSATLTLDQLLALLGGRSRPWWYKNRRKLEAEGFPAMIPVLRRWPAAAVRAWIDGAAAEQTSGAPEAQDEEARIASKLDERAEALAAGALRG